MSNGPLVVIAGDPYEEIRGLYLLDPFGSITP
jgi:hypothetical protein